MHSAVIGAGFLGAKIVSFFNENNLETIGTAISKLGFERLDISDKKMVEKFFSEFQPENTVLCASLSNVDECEDFPKKAEKINVQGTKNVFDACKKNNSKLVFISSDYVFDGLKGDYSEKDKPGPIQVYGKTKLEGEKIVLLEQENVVLRISSLYGKSTIAKKTFESHIVESISGRKKIMAAVDQITCPTLIDDVAKAAFYIIENEKKGLFHCTGSEAISRHGFAIKVAEEYGLDKSFIQKTSLKELKFRAKRPQNSSLNIGKITKLGVKMSNIKEGLKKSNSFNESG